MNIRHFAAAIRRYAVRGNGMSREQFEQMRDKLIQKAPPPTIWLFGKTGSGKSSIIKFLTGADEIQIGNGFHPTTRRTDLYEFPDANMPMLRFMDTRGLGEAGYDPTEDIATFEHSVHAMIVTQKVMDFAIEPVREPLVRIRRGAATRPVLLALTCLHEAYPGRQHPPYPFADSLDSPRAPDPLRRSIAQHRQAFEKLVDVIVPVDLTRPEDGFEQSDYGGQQLRDALIKLLPSAYRYVLHNAADVLAGLKDLHERRAMSYVYGAAQLAATTALSPVPWIDIPFLVAIQTRMVHAIARVYHQQSTTKEVMEMLAVGGAGFAMRMGTRELIKVIPYVGTITGGILGAALGYSYTYALGKVCCWYYGALLDGHQPSEHEIRRVFKRQWQEGQKLWKTMQHEQKDRS